MNPKRNGWRKRLIGRWRIAWMDQFGRKDIDEEVPAHITLGKGGLGSFQFILVSGDICGDFKDDAQMLDFTWIGNDECDEASGDGWIRLVSESRAEGEIRFHKGDTYKFRAVKAKNAGGRKKCG